jgi:hypothetical protein
MALFVEVFSEDKQCDVIVNLDEVLEIAPLAAGGCALFFSDAAAVGGKTSYKVTTPYSQFKQFAMQTVSAEDIASRFPKVTVKEDAPVNDIIKASKTKGKGIVDDLKIPKL